MVDDGECFLKLELPSRSGSTPIIWGEFIFLNVADGDNLEFWALDRASGKVRWKKPMAAGNFKINKHNMSSPSPVTDGKTIWVMTGTGVIKASVGTSTGSGAKAAFGLGGAWSF